MYYYEFIYLHFNYAYFQVLHEGKPANTFFFLNIASLFFSLLLLLLSFLYCLTYRA